MTIFSRNRAAFFAIVLTPVAAFAATEMDANGDGAYSFEEILASVPTLTQETYAALDTNADGAVDADELAAAMDAGVLPSDG